MATRALLLMLLILSVSGLSSQQPPSEDPRAIFGRAQTALLNQDYARAEAGFQEVLRLYPHSVAALSNLGVVSMRTEKYGRAIQSFRKARELNPQVPGISLNLGLPIITSKTLPWPSRSLSRCSERNPAVSKAGIYWE